MIGQKNVVLGILKSRFDAERAIESLKTEGFSNADISVLMPSKSDSQNFGHVRASKAPEGAATGAGAGAFLGGSLGLLIGLGVFTIPGLGVALAAGPLMITMAGAGVGGALGGVAGALIGLGIPEYEAKRYEGYLKEGGILLSVHTDSPEKTARARIRLLASGAKDLSSTSETKSGTNWLKSKKSSDPPTSRV